MALAVGLVSFKTPENAEGTLKSAHGLKHGDWKRVLKTGVSDILDLDIRTTSGTFRELARVAWHWNVANVYTNVHKRETYPEIRFLGPVSFANGDTVFSLRDLISRSRHTGADYADIIGEESQIHRVIVELTEGNRTLSIKSSGLRAPKDRKDLQFPRDDPSVPLWISNDLDNSELSMTMVDSFPNGDRLSEFIKLYLTSYLIGMLSRYFPARWMSLIRNDAGSISQPLLAKAVRAIETDFISEFAQQIAVVLNDPGFFGEHFEHLSKMFAHDWRSGWKEPEHKGAIDSRN